MSNQTAKQLRARLRAEARAINERNRVPGDLYYREPVPQPEQPALTEAEAQLVIGAIPLQALPEQPAREGEGWYQLPDENGNFDFYTDSGKRVGRATSMEFLQTIVTDHARAALVRWMIVEFQLLRDTAFAFHVDEKHKPEAFATCQHHVCLRACEVWNNVTAAARKAGVE